jgi:uncharacterized membrane protein
MAIVNSLLLAAHLAGLAMIVGATLVLWRAGGVLARGEASPGMTRLGKRVIAFGDIGLGLNWISGPVMIFTKYGGFGAFVMLGPWFWLKLAFVVALSGMLGVAGGNFRRASEGTAEAGIRVERFGGIAALCAVGVIVAAAFTFG